MSGSIRVSAKTVDDAITEASIQLGITSDRLDYEIIEKGSAGFLGIGAKQAVIEAQRKEANVEPKSDKGIDKAPAYKEKVKKEVKSEQKEEPKKEEPKKVESKKTETKKAEPQKVIKEEAPISSTKEKETSFESKKAEPSFIKERSLAAVEEQTIEAVNQFLIDTTTAMKLDVKVISSVDNEGALSVELIGEQMGILIGKRGQTLDSLQYLANRVANKHQEEYVRVKLDTENYRTRREETLERLARSLASKVKRTRRPLSLEPMNPYERRVIHSILQNDRFVTTHSEGEEPYRKVVITLKNNRKNY